MTPMTRSLSTLNIVLLLLVGLTLLSWWAGTNGGFGSRPASWSGIGILAIAMFKVRLVVRHFMEVDQAPLVLRIVIDLWALVLLIALSILYSTAGQHSGVTHWSIVDGDF
jgi:heme/copper-type cytochrome/quinol oxidase subunit 4